MGSSRAPESAIHRRTVRAAGGDGDVHLVLVPVEVLGELAPAVHDLLGGDAGRQGDVDLDAAAGETIGPSMRRRRRPWPRWTCAGR